MKYLDLLEYAELQYKFALAVSGTIQCHEFPALTYLDSFSYGKHVFNKEDLLLTKEQEILAATLIEHSAIYLCAVQADTVLQVTIHDRFNHSNKDICCTAWIIRLIRNAFAHNPFAPIWKTYPECRDRIFTVKDIISMNTANLNGKAVKRLDYGGPLALLRLLDYVKEIAEDSA